MSYLAELNSVLDGWHRRIPIGSVGIRYVSVGAVGTGWSRISVVTSRTALRHLRREMLRVCLEVVIRLGEDEHSAVEQGMIFIYL